MGKAFAAFFAFLALTCAARAETVYAKMPAHPAMWTVHGPKGTAYLFGSMHLLPSNVDWHTKEIDAAMAKSDTLVFELAMDDKFQERMGQYILARGMLPEGQHLHDMLSPEAKKELDADVTRLALAPDAVDRMRPWLAELTIEVMGMTKENHATSGPDIQISSNTGGKPVIGLETIEQQMALLAPSDPKAELQAFEANLKTSASAGSADDQIGPLLDAWMHGRVDRLAALTKKDFEKYPDAQKALFDDRNAAWVTKISSLLDEPKIYFITVGAGHLAGPRGVPALLRAKGFKVEGP